MFGIVYLRATLELDLDERLIEYECREALCRPIGDLRFLIGFLNETMPGRYRPQEAAQAWELLRAFLAEVFSGAWPGERVRWEFEGASGADYDFTRNVRLE